MWAFFVVVNRLGWCLGWGLPDQNGRHLSQWKALRTEFARSKRANAFQRMQAVPFRIPEITA